ncbi:MAG TPA: hypothetical protein VFE50_24485 [Cyclobacteriaceae bacterium]|nr:hypothetical protein [Cyclobacteriaceae bacterium]
MKTNIQLKSLFLLALCAVLSSFASPFGAHSFQVYLDDKLVAEQYVRPGLVPKITVDGQSQLVVKYNECNKPCSARVLTIKDEKDKVLKEWKFEGNTVGFEDPMTCSLKEIAAFKQKNVKLYYSSAQFAQGQLVATLTFSSFI